MEAVFPQALPGHGEWLEEGCRGRRAWSKEVNCAAGKGESGKGKLATGVENGPLCSAALQKAPLTVRAYHANVTLTLFSVDPRSSLQMHFSLKVFISADLAVFYRSYHGHSGRCHSDLETGHAQSENTQWSSSVAANDVSRQCLNLFETLEEEDQWICFFFPRNTTVSKDTFHAKQRSEQTPQSSVEGCGADVLCTRGFDINSPAEAGSSLLPSLS